jgi:HAD superfamily hydrolase (TIGR01490 family)
MKHAALFDVDKTLVTVNTARLYVKWRMDRSEAGLGEYLQMSRVLLKYALGTLDAEDTARKGFRAVAGYDEATMRGECRAWYQKIVRPHISDDARRELEKRQRQGYVVGILSASTAYLTEPLAEDLGIDHVLCTRLTVQDGKLTGDYERPLCYGPGKVQWARDWAEAHGVSLERSIFYTDSISDLPMLEAVGSPRVVNPDPRLRLLALRRRYPVEHWK